MMEFSFQALGTNWSILIDAQVVKEDDQKAVQELVWKFEKRFSRFILTSEVNQFRNSETGEFTISREFSEMLKVSLDLKEMTQGIYNPVVGALLEIAGYNKDYTFVTHPSTKNFIAPTWNLDRSKLTINGPTAFDLGGIGKGYCIDLVAELLREKGYKYFLVEAGGDMFASEKKDGTSFEIALEWPGKKDCMFGKIALKNRGLAASDVFKRRWKNWHHIVNPITKQPIQNIIGCTAVAKNAFFADCMTSGLFLSPQNSYQKIAQKFEGEFVVFTQDQKIKVSQGWPGELY